jgi:SPP1 gp7 family putative phage head morphogenesis protein
MSSSKASSTPYEPEPRGNDGRGDVHIAPQFKKELMPLLQSADPKRNWWGKRARVNEETGEITEIQLGSPCRLKTIYGTNLQTAYMAGNYKGAMEAAADLPNWQYISVIDGRTTDQCRDMHGRVFRFDDPIWDSLYPPNHWGCRAKVRELTDAEVRREGLKVENSERRLVEQTVTVGKGDKAHEVTVTGLDLGNGKTFWAGPGWDYNPGKEAWMPELEKYHPADAKSFIRESFGGPDYKRFFDAAGKIGGAIPIAVLDEDYGKALSAKTNIVRLSAYNLWKSDVKHPDISISDLQQTQLHLDEADVAAIVPGEHRLETLVLFNKIGKTYYKTVFKASEDKSEVFFLPMHECTKTHAENVLKKAIRFVRGNIGKL